MNKEKFTSDSGINLKELVDILSSRTEEIGLISIRSSLGKEIIFFKLSSVYDAISDLQEGVYTLTILTGAGKFEKRFIIEK